MTDAALKLASSMATRELLAALVAQYQQDSGQVVTAEAAGGVEVAKRVEQGEQFDLVVLAASAIDKLAAAGHVVAGSRVDLVHSGVAIAVRKGARQWPVNNEAEVRAAVLAAHSLGFSTGPSGVYLEQLFQRWGILDTVRPRIIVPPPGVPVGSLVATGQAELGFQQLSELMNLQGIDLLGPLPPEIQTLTVFSGGICAASTRRDAAAALLAFMASAEVAELKRQHGMEPAG
jgi:molybdate transport system substrate-binding protein